MSFVKKSRQGVVLLGASALLSLSLAAVGAPAASALTEVPGAFNPVTPERVLDTREEGGAIPGGGSVVVDVAGAGYEGAGAVVLNVTVTKGQGPGHITVFPTGGQVPTASNLNFVANQTIANAVTVAVGEDGTVTLRNGSAQPVQVIADVAGYYASGNATQAGMFRAVSPARLLDTREGIGAAKRQVAGRGTVSFSVANEGLGIPNNAVAAVLNVTVTKGTGPGHITAFPAGAQVPEASNLNFAARQTIANAVTVPLSADGRVSLYNGSSAPVDLLADVAGYFIAGDAELEGAFVPVTPQRLLDTRTDEWEGTSTDFEDGSGDFGPLPSDEAVYVPVEAALDLPEFSVSAAVVNVTATRGTRNGHITAYDGENEIPLASSLNFLANQTIPNQVTVELVEFGDFGLYNGSPGSVHLIADISGYYLSGDLLQ